MFLLDRLKKKPAEETRQEQRYQGEPYLPPDLERFRIGEDSDANSPITPSLEIPEKQRKFRAFAREMGNPSDIGFMETARQPAEKRISENESSDNEKLDMILQKLETMDLRLKLIEQRLESRGV